MVLGFEATATPADLLTEDERAWLKSKGTIQFVSQTVYPPFEFINRIENPQGMCIELVQWLSTELGFKASFQNMTFQEAQEAILSGQADVLTSLFYSKTRDLHFDFTDMTWEVPALIFVRAERPDISNLNDLQGKRIAMQRGDYAAEFLKSKNIEYVLVPTATFAEAADRVIAGEADAVIGDQQIVLYHLFSNGLTDRMKSVGNPLYIGRNCMGVKQGRQHIVAILNKGLALARKRGIFDLITRKWIGTSYALPPSWLQRHAWYLAVALATVAAFAVLVIVWSLRIRRISDQRARELLEVRDTLKPVEHIAIKRLGLRTWLWLLLILIPIYLSADFALRQYVILPSFFALEQEEVKKAVTSNMDALKREIHHLGQIAGDWAVWDDTYRFVQDGNTGYADSNFQWKSLISSGIHMITILDPEGKVVWTGSFDPVQKKKIAIDEFPRDLFPKDHPLLQHHSLDSEIMGIVLTQSGPMLVVSRPIVKSTGEGPSRGVLVMGRFLLKETIEDLIKQARVNLRVQNLRSEDLDERDKRALSRFSSNTDVIIEQAGEDVLIGYGLLRDLDTRPALLISATISREISQRGRAMANLVSVIILVALCLIAMLLLTWFISSITEASHRQKHIEALVEQRTAALREREQFLSDLFNSIQDGISVLNPDLTIRHVNRIVNEWYGEHVPLEGKKCFNCYQNVGEPCSPCPTIRCLKSGKTETDIVPGPSGSDIQWLEVYSYPLKDHPAGQVHGVIEFYRNITQRKQAEKELSESEARLKGLLDHLENIPVQGYDENRLIIFWNAASTSVYGYTREEALGRRLEDLIIPEHLKDRVVEAINRWVTDGTPIPAGELVLRDKYGNDVPVFTSHIMQQTHSGKKEMFCANVDFRALRQSEKERAKLQEQYQQAQKVEAIGRLAGGVAHDLNNLLTPILGYGELLLRDLGVDESHKKQVKQIVQASLRARDLVRQLLAFSRRQTLEMKPLNINRVISAFEKLLRRTIRENIGIRTILAPHLPTILADSGLIEQVIMNLAINASDAMPSGGTLSIETALVKLDEDDASTHQSVQSGEYVMVAISDTGCGMDKEIRSHLFEPFFSTKGEFGTGLGLSTVYDIVKQHNGSIWVYSEPGKGTTFKLFLPVPEQATPEMKTAVELPVDLTGAETILVVDDDAQVIDLGRAILKQQGYTVLLAENGGQALTVLETYDGPVHLLLTDIIMPGMNGRELYMKASEKYPDLRVLYMSGYPDNIIAHHGLLDTGIAFIQKPFDLQTLLVKVREVLRKRK